MFNLVFSVLLLRPLCKRRSLLVLQTRRSVMGRCCRFHVQLKASAEELKVQGRWEIMGLNTFGAWLGVVTNPHHIYHSVEHIEKGLSWNGPETVRKWAFLSRNFIQKLMPCESCENTMVWTTSFECIGLAMKTRGPTLDWVEDIGQGYQRYQAFQQCVEHVELHGPHPRCLRTDVCLPPSVWPGCRGIQPEPGGHETSFSTAPPVRHVRWIILVLLKSCLDDFQWHWFF